MRKKYNIALIPSNETQNIIKLAAKFSCIADNYLLGKNSLPHVTLMHFTAEDHETHEVWNSISGTWKSSLINLSFDNFSCITFDNEIFWASLMPNNRELLLDMHKQIATLLKYPINKKYDPHMTLINTREKNYEKLVQKEMTEFHPIADNFILSMGRSDEVGQLIDTLFRAEHTRSVCSSIV